MNERLDLPEDTLAQVDEYLGHVEDGRWVCVWRDAYGIEYDAYQDMQTLHARVRELEAQAATDASIAEAARECVRIAAEVDMLDKDREDYIEIYEELWFKADAVWQKLRDVLAAEEEGE